MNLSVNLDGRRRSSGALRLLVPGLMLLGSTVAEGQITVQVAQPLEARVARVLDLTGTVSAERDAALSPRVDGLVERVFVDAGDRVKRGAPLLQLDASLAKLTLESAEAALDEGRTRLAETQRLRDEAKTLAARGDIPQSQYRTREADVLSAQATVARLDAERREQAERVQRHHLPAPFDGLVRRRLTDTGEWVGTGMPVLELVATEPLRIDVQVPQAHLAAIDRKTAVQVRLDAAPDHPYDGQVLTAVGASDPSTRTFLVRVGVPQSDVIAAPGMSARLRFELARGTPALDIPRDAVKRYPDGTTTVWIVEGAAPEWKAREVPVVLGDGAPGVRVTVIDGLQADQPVVVRGNESLRAGQVVRVQSAAGR